MIQLLVGKVRVTSYVDDLFSGPITQSSSFIGDFFDWLNSISVECPS